jgi:hypothetical protein
MIRLLVDNVPLFASEEAVGAKENKKEQKNIRP